ncbi:MAG: protein translocase subunit SecD [Chloroflexota bacterium]
MKTYYKTLLYTFPVLILAIWIALPGDPAVIFDKHFTTHLGLDLVGGVQILLEADLPEDTDISQESMDTTRQIIESRANGLGVAEVVLQQTGDRRILVELPGENDAQKAIDVIGETGQLEFVDMGPLTLDQTNQLEFATIFTDYPVMPTEVPEGVRVWHTIMTGESIKTAGAQTDELGRYVVGFELDLDGATVFREYTSNNIGSSLALVLDKQIISLPSVNTAIPNGQGSISGNFDIESANDLAVQLRYGSLPIALKVSQSRTIGPSLGQDSLDKSLQAGLIGFGMILVFMAAYYRLPGLVANIALMMYVVFTVALFKIIPITLTLPGIAGFILSIGVAVDANILIFERMREELKSGKKLSKSIDLGWNRAWSSIRDSNISTLITCAILYWFGSVFGASVVKGFALTLALGVGVSLITAITITRSLLHLILDNIKILNYRLWFGVKESA